MIDPLEAPAPAAILPRDVSSSPPDNPLVDLVVGLQVAPRRTPLRLDRDLLDACVAAAAPNAWRALMSDLRAYEAWCRAQGGASVPGSPALVAAYLQARDDGGAAASLGRLRRTVAYARPAPSSSRAHI